MKITATMLRKAEACSEQVDIFREEWPRGCVVNEANIRRALELELDVWWVVEYLFSRIAKDAFREKCTNIDETWINIWQKALCKTSRKV
ncbi:MAG: hypothetical protein EHM48_07185, partial [Planctomycetaceae bacterium]